VVITDIGGLLGFYQAELTCIVAAGAVPACETWDSAIEISCGLL
jgi:hypothetical protein